MLARSRRGCATGNRENGNTLALEEPVGKGCWPNELKLKRQTPATQGLTSTKEPPAGGCSLERVVRLPADRGGLWTAGTVDVGTGGGMTGAAAGKMMTEAGNAPEGRVR